MASAPPPVFPLPPDWPIGADVLVRLGRVKGGRKADDRLDSTITQSEQTVRETHQRLLNERSQSVCSSLVFFIRAGVKTTVNLRPEGAKKKMTHQDLPIWTFIWSWHTNQQTLFKDTQSHLVSHACARTEEVLGHGGVPGDGGRAGGHSQEQSWELCGVLLSQSKFFLKVGYNCEGKI